MKLYTEEEVINLANRITNEGTESILAGLSAIELPNDEEISNKSKNCVWGTLAFELGAIWVIEQIKQQSNG